MEFGPIEDFKPEMNIDEYVVVTPGTVFDHTMLVMKEMAKQTKEVENEDERFILMMSALLHDIGKPAAGKKNGIHPVKNVPDVHDHDVVGAPIAYDFCKSLGMKNEDCNTIKSMVESHMEMHKLSEKKSRLDRLELINKKEFPLLIKLARADDFGCYVTAEDEDIYIDEALELDIIKSDLNTKIPEPILTGKDLIGKGHKPGKEFKKALRVALKLQVDQGITDKDLLYRNIKSLLKP